MQNFESSEELKQTIKMIEQNCQILENLQIGFSCGLPDYLTEPIVGKMCQKMSEKTGDIFVYTNHKVGFEITRLEHKLEYLLYKEFSKYVTSPVEKPEPELKAKKPKSDEKDFDNLKACEFAIKELLKKYQYLDYKQVSKIVSFFPESLFDQGVISYSYIQRKIASTACFRNYSKGPTQALRDALQILCDGQILESIPLYKIVDYGSKMECYKILQID